MRLLPILPGIPALLLVLSPPASGQTTPSATGDPILDKQRDIIQGRTAFDASIDKNSDGKIDVRDMALYVNGKPVSATFSSAETLAFYAENLTVEVTVHFSKAITGTVQFNVGGSAVEGQGEDFTILYQDAAQKSFSVTNARSLVVPIRLSHWRGVGGEKIIRLSISRKAGVIPENGTFSTHLLRIRQYDAGEFVGTLSFAGGAGLSAVPVRLGLFSSGKFDLTFERESALLGTALTGSWTGGSGGFPGIPQEVPIQIPGAALGRTESVRGSLSISRLTDSISPENQAYLEGFPAGDRPALYEVRLDLHNLFAAGGSAPNAFSFSHQGRLALQAVHYSDFRP